MMGAFDHDCHRTRLWLVVRMIIAATLARNFWDLGLRTR